MQKKPRPDSHGSQGFPQLRHPSALNRRSTRKKITPSPPPPRRTRQRPTSRPQPRPLPKKEENNKTPVVPVDKNNDKTLTFPQVEEKKDSRHEKPQETTPNIDPVVNDQDESLTSLKRTEILHTELGPDSSPTDSGENVTTTNDDDPTPVSDQEESSGDPVSDANGIDVLEDNEDNEDNEDVDKDSDDDEKISENNVEDDDITEEANSLGSGPSVTFPVIPIPEEEPDVSPEEPVRDEHVEPDKDIHVISDVVSTGDNTPVPTEDNHHDSPVDTTEEEDPGDKEEPEETVVEEDPSNRDDQKSETIENSIITGGSTPSSQYPRPSEYETSEFPPIPSGVVNGVLKETIEEESNPPEPATEEFTKVPIPETKESESIPGEKPVEETSEDTKDSAPTEKKTISRTMHGREIRPAGEKEEKVKKPKIFWTTMACWGALIVASGSLLSGWGYSLWLDAESEKKANIAYEQGAEDIISDPTFDSVVKIEDDEFSTLIGNYPGNELPEGYQITDRELIGWSIPGGTEYNGRADVEICWTALDTEGENKSRVYLVSENAQDESPTWIIDAMTTTGESCSPDDNEQEQEQE